MTKVKVLLAGAVMALGTAFSTAPALAWPGSGWTLLGTRVVSDRMDSDVISVPGRARYAQIKICVYRNPIRVYDIDVRYRNGDNQDISVRHRLRAGQCTRNIDLDGRRRDIRSIRMMYEETSWGRGRTATVRVFGR
jgi:hypothetical protein